MNLGDEEARDRLLAELMSDALRGPSNQIAHLDPKRLSARELPPGTWSQLYVLYQASCLAEERPCASRAVFYACTDMEEGAEIQTLFKALNLQAMRPTQE